MRKEITEQKTIRKAAVTQLYHAPVIESTRTPEELLHELQVHQIGLEMQYEKLQRAYVALKESRDNYINLYDFSPVGYLTLTHNGLIVEANLTAAALLGIDRQDLLHHHFAAFVAPKDADLWYIFFSELKKSILRNNVELFLKHSDGHKLPVLLNYLHITFSNKDLMLRISLTDITENKSMATEIDDALKYAESIIETMREPLMVLSSDLKVVTANLSFYKTFKVTPDETVGYFIYDIGNRQWDIPKLRILLEDILPNTTVFNDYEVEHCFPYIGYKVFLLNAREIFREKIGRHIILLSMEDITENKQQENESSIAAIAFESNEGMLVTDANGIILRANHAFTQITSYTAEELIGKNPRILQSGLHPEKFYAAMWESVKDHGVWSGEVWNRRKDGVCYPEHHTITAVVDANGSVSNYIGIIVDSTISHASAEEIKHLAFYDPLTGLPNIRLLRDRLKPALASSTYTKLSQYYRLIRFTSLCTKSNIFGNYYVYSIAF
jgi:PAS domain S-box-containing protein